MCSSTNISLIFWTVLTTFCSLSAGQSTNAGTNASPFLPFSWPLAIKGPYLNSWQAGLTSGTSLPFSTPAFWPAWDDQTTWSCVLVIDDIPYRILGSNPPSVPTIYVLANQTTVTFTASKTTFTLIAGPMEVNATFLSPVTPNDLTRQSMPFAYLYLEMSSLDGNAHNIRVYSDITPQWLHGNEVRIADPNPKVAANASLINSTDFIGLQMQLEVPRPFVEVAEHAQDVIGVFAMKFDPAIKYQVGMNQTVRELGINSTGLQNTIDTGLTVMLTALLCSPFDVYAITLELGAIQNTSAPIMWTIGMLRDPAINFTTASGAELLRSSLYWSKFSSIPDLISFVLDDFDSARSSADAFDEMIQNVSLSHIPGYADLLALTTRQIFGTLEITVSKSSDGSWNRSDIMVFSKDMGDVGSTGSSGGTNVVDVLYAGFPAMLYLNPRIGGYLLRPILESQISDGVLIGQPYAPRHLGNQFPNASCDTTFHNQGIEESGNMLIMVLAHLQMTNDWSLVQNYYPLLKNWADYLVNQTLNADFQSTSLSDGIKSFNQTNLVLKGIIGISAMGVLSGELNKSDDQVLYQKVSEQYLQVWLDNVLSLDQTRLLSSFGDQNSGGLIYNMYADKLLGLNLIPPNISAVQLGFYESLFGASRTPYGTPLDNSNSSLSRLDWTMFSAASVLNGDGSTNAPVVLQQAISALHNYAASQTDNAPLSVIYNPSNGKPISGSNSFAAGALFAPLVMGAKVVNSNGTPGDSDTPANHKSPIQSILGAVIGGVCAILVFVLVLWLYFRRTRRTAHYSEKSTLQPETRGELQWLSDSQNGSSETLLPATLASDSIQTSEDFTTGMRNPPPVFFRKGLGNITEIIPSISKSGPGRVDAPRSNDTISESDPSTASPSLSTTQTLAERRLADLMVQIRRAHDADVPVESRSEASEAPPPSYDSRSLYTSA